MGKGKPNRPHRKAPGTPGKTRCRTLGEMDEAGCTNEYFHDLAVAVRGLLPDLGDGSGRRCEFVLVVGGLDAHPRMVSSLLKNSDIREFLAAIVKDIDARTMEEGVKVARSRETGELISKPMDPDRQRLPGGTLPPRQKAPKSWLPSDYDPEQEGPK